MKSHGNRAVDRAQMAAYRQDALTRTPEVERQIRRMLGVGRLGVQLRLDEVPGVVWVRGCDHGAPGVTMPAGQAHLEVWGGDPAEVFAAVRRAKPAHVALTVRWHRATWWQRLRRRVRWWVWRTLGEGRSHHG